MQASQHPFMADQSSPYAQQATPQQPELAHIVSITPAPSAPPAPMPAAAPVAPVVQPGHYAMNGQPPPPSFPPPPGHGAGHYAMNGQPPPPSTPPPPGLGGAILHQEAGNTVTQIAVAAGAVQGQQILFRAPDGRSVCVVAPQHLAPGAMISVSYPGAAAQGPQQQQMLAPALPPAMALSPEQQDRRAAKVAWWLYAGGWVCCCCSPLISFVLWMVVTMVYYCKPSQVRAIRPQQGRPAKAAAITATSFCACGLFAGLISIGVLAACGPDLQRCQLGQHIHHPVAPHGGNVNLTLSGYGFACEDTNEASGTHNQRYLHQGHTQDGHAYYRGETAADMFLYYDKQAAGIPGPAWILGQEPSLTADHGLAAPFSYDGFILSGDEEIPVGTQGWDEKCRGRVGMASVTIMVEEVLRPDGTTSLQAPKARAGVPVVAWHVRDHAEGKTFDKFEDAESFFKQKAWPGGFKWAARLYHANGDKEDQYGGMSVSDWNMLDEWAKEATLQGAAAEPIVV